MSQVPPRRSRDAQRSGDARPSGRRRDPARPGGRARREPRRVRRWLLGASVLVVGSSLGPLVAVGSRIAREPSPEGGQATARCVPSQLNVSAQLAGTNLDVSPLPNSYDASPHTQISMLGAPAADISNVTATGSFTGEHTGQLIAYSQGDGASFVPEAPFAQGETVAVHGELHSGRAVKDFGYQFTVDYPDPIYYERPGSKVALTAGSYQSFHSAPQLHPPDVEVTHSTPEAEAEGDIFTAPYAGPGQMGPMITEPDGQLVWMYPEPENVFSTNLQVQTLYGEKVLSWWQGYIPQNGFGIGEEVVANSSYQPIMHVDAGNGDKADLHVFSIEPNNAAVLTVFNTIHCDLSAVGGPADGDVTDTAFQELDLKTGLVRREWTPIDHVSLNAAYASDDHVSAEWPWDYFHLNTVDERSDGTTLLSARNTSQLYLINSDTGQITASIGGKKSSVTVGAGAETAYQHDATTLPDGDISIFDNGGSPFTSHSQSRALVIEVNLHSNTDTRVAEFVHPRALQASSQGSVQLLPNGNWFVGWGGEPYFSEFNASGEMIYDAHLPAEIIPNGKNEHANSYRAYQFEWSGTPASPPAIAAETQGHGLTVYASWNGATEVASWEVLGGASQEHLSPLTSATKSGFETAMTVPSEAYVEVQALDSAGAAIGHSAVIAG
jgi:hypothetical protein